VTRVVLEFEGGDKQPASQEEREVPTELDSRIAILFRDWVVRVLEPYLRDRRLPAWQSGSTSGVQDEILTVIVVSDGEDVKLGLRLGSDLLEDLLSTYALWGWEAVVAAGSTDDSKDDRVRNFVQATQLAAYHMVREGLLDVQRIAHEYAAARWKAARENLEKHLTGLIQVSRLRESTWRFSDSKPGIGAGLVAMCKEYVELEREAERLGKRVAGRRKGAYREPGSGADLWFEVYAAPQRETLAKMAAKLLDIHKVFPAAVLVLGDLPSGISGRPERGARGDVETDPRGEVDSSPPSGVALEDTLATEIHGTVRRLVEDLKWQEAYLEAPWTPAPDAIGGKSWNLVGGGIESIMLKDLLAATEGPARVMANPELLAALAGDLDSEGILPRESWSAIVLFQYRRRLAVVIEARRERDAAWRRFWDRLARVTAALALLGALGIFPFSGPTVARGLMLLFQAAGAASGGLGIVLTIMHQVVGQLQLAAALAREAQEQLFRLAQEEPESLKSIGDVLAESAAIRRQFSDGLLVLLLEEGLSRFRAIAQALDLIDQIENVEAVFGPTPDEA
jgi:hypothetical protein